VEPAVIPEPAVVPDAVSVSADDVTVAEAPAASTPPPPPPPTAEVETPAAEAWPEVVVIPEAQPVKVATASAPGPNSDAEVLDVLHRLVPEAHEPPPPSQDAADLRTRLARTAALKKPGSRERQEGREDLPHQ